MIEKHIPVNQTYSLLVFAAAALGLHEFLHFRRKDPSDPGDILPVQEGELLHDGGPEGVEVGVEFRVGLADHNAPNKSEGFGSGEFGGQTFGDQWWKTLSSSQASIFLEA